MESSIYDASPSSGPLVRLSHYSEVLLFLLWSVRGHLWLLKG